MKVLIVSHCFHPFIGGLEEVAFQQAKRLSKKGHEVQVITSNIGNGNSKLDKEEEIEGVRIYRVSASNYLYNNFDIPQPIFNVYELNQKLKEFIQSTDLVHIHDRYYMTSFFAAKTAKKLKKPILLTIHVDKIKYNNSIYNFLFKFNDKISNYVVKNSKKISVLNLEMKKNIDKNFTVSSIVLNNGVDVDQFSPLSLNDKIKLKKYMGISENQFIILFVGRFTFKKGIDYLVEISKKLKTEKFDEILLIVIGDGPEKKSVESILKNEKIDNIKLEGKIIDKKILSNYYKISDLLLFPSRKGEGSPLVILEAISSGLPVIIKNTGFHAKIIKDNKTGYLVQTTDQMFEKIILLYKNPKLLKEISINSRKYSKEFSWSKNVDKLVSVYSSLFNKF